MPALVITEKPSVAREIAAVLGETGKGEGFIKAGDITFTWAVGHLLSLVEPHVYNPEWKKWDIDLLPILPENFSLQPIDANAKKQISTIKKIYKSGEWDYIVNACDAGREGELIFAWVKEYCKLKGDFRRLWLASLTKSAIKTAWSELHQAEEYYNLENAARQRAEADWLVGLNATRAASVQLRGAFVGKQVLSLGRVQTPTLALIVRREHEIKNFVPETYYNVDATFAAEKGNYVGRLFFGNNEKLSLEYAEKAAQACINAEGEITDLQKKQVKEQAPLLFDLTSLQREANSKLGFSAKRTLQSAQRLYEAHKMLTYPRTDSRYLTTDMKEEIPDLLKKLGKYEPFAKFTAVVPNFKRSVNDKKVSDHHAIIPTGVVKQLEGDDAKLYRIVTQRFLACLHPEALVEKTSIRTTVSKEEDFIFRSRGRIILEAGWRAVYGEEADENKNTEEMQDQSLPMVQQNEKVKVKDIKSVEKQTQPPAQFSDATLLGAMETAGKFVEDEELKEALKEGGLGTPATRAAIIEGLISRQYVDRDGKKLVPTEKGVHLIDILGEHPLTSAELTGNWEKQLSEISTGNLSTQEFQKGIRSFTTQTVEDFRKLSPQNVERANVGKCPECGKDVIENRKGYSCWSKSDPGCGFVIWKNHYEKTITPEIMKQLVESKETHTIEGWKSGNQNFSSRLKLEKNNENKWEVRFVDAPEWAKTQTKESVGVCPNCAKEIWENRKGYSCWTRSDPGCGFVVWKQQGKVLIDLEHFKQLLDKKETQTDYGVVKIFKDKEEEWMISVGGVEKKLINKKPAPKAKKK